MKTQTKELIFDDFKKLAKNNSLSPYEKIGFPDSYRKDYEDKILNDIINKLYLNNENKKTIIDIGCGCSDLAKKLINFCEEKRHTLILVDSKEMLCLLPNKSFIKKYEGYFPDIPELFNHLQLKIDYAVCYSVLHYIFSEGNIYNFIHRTLELLKPGGKFLLGDIPNISKKKRFLATSEGKIFLKNFRKKSDMKGSTYHSDETQKIDDSVIFSILARMRSFGHETYVLPQPKNLPMENRREDILIIK